MPIPITSGELSRRARDDIPKCKLFRERGRVAVLTDPNYRTTMPDVLHEFAWGSQRDLSAFKDRVNLVKPGEDIVAGMRVLDTDGHTPGHISLELAGGES